MWKIVKIFHRQTDRHTDRPTNLPLKTRPQSLKNKLLSKLMTFHEIYLFDMPTQLADKSFEYRLA